MTEQHLVGVTPTPVTVADIQAEIPQYAITSSSVPSTTQVSGYITNISAEVRALVQGCGAQWPADATSDAAIYLKQTIIEGVLEKVLRARYSKTRTGMQPEELAAARNAYLDRKRNICQVAKGVQMSETEAEGGQAWPVLVDTGTAPSTHGSFFGWTHAVDQQDRHRHPGPFR